MTMSKKITDYASANVRRRARFLAFFLSLSAIVASVGLTVFGKVMDVPLGVALALTAAFPVVLLLLGFYLPVERRRLRRLLPILGR